MFRHHQRNYPTHTLSHRHLTVERRPNHPANALLRETALVWLTTAMGGRAHIVVRVIVEWIPGVVARAAHEAGTAFAVHLRVHTSVFGGTIQIQLAVR